MALLDVINASFAYEQSSNIFENINFKLNKGEIFCLLGPNGCGKTTLLDCILGVNRLQKGNIFFNSKDTNTLHSGELARYIAYVPQNHERTFPYTVLDIVKMGRAAYTGRFSVPSVRDTSIAQEALDIVGLSHLQNRPYTQLSGGEGQLVMIARALAQKTPVIIMDEPTAHLDFKHEMVVLETIVKMVKNTELSIIMASHFPNHAFYFENNEVPIRAALMSEHKFLQVGRPLDVLNESNLKELYRVNTRMLSCKLDSKNELRQIIPLGTVKN